MPPRGKPNKSKMYWPNTPWTWTFFGIVVVQAIIIMALEAYVPLTPSDPVVRDKGLTDDCRYAFAMLEVFLIDKPSTIRYVKEVPTSLTLYIFAMIYWLYLTWDALRLKNTIQIIGLCISDFALVVYGAVQTKQVKDIVDGLRLEGIVIDEKSQSQINPSLVAIPIVLAVGAVLMSMVAWKLYDEFAWTIYKNISADLRMKQRYLNYQVRQPPRLSPASSG